jgi:SAM-dependent MidA family methyltransferase
VRKFGAAGDFVTAPGEHPSLFGQYLRQKRSIADAWLKPVVILLGLGSGKKISAMFCAGA